MGSGSLPTHPFFGYLLKNRPKKRPGLLILQYKVTGLLTLGTLSMYLQNERQTLSESSNHSCIICLEVVREVTCSSTFLWKFV